MLLKSSHSNLNGVVLQYRRKYVTKISPKPPRIFFVPMVALLVTVPVALLILGPLGYNVGGAFSYLIVELYQRLGWLATGLLCRSSTIDGRYWHAQSNDSLCCFFNGRVRKEMLYLPASLAHNIAESGACFAVSLKNKKYEIATNSDFCRNLSFIWYH